MVAMLTSPSKKQKPVQKAVVAGSRGGVVGRGRMWLDVVQPPVDGQSSFTFLTSVYF